MTNLTEMFDQVQWQPLTLDFAPKDDEAYATHRGVMTIDAVEVRCYRFSNGSTALDIEDIERFFRGCPHCSNPSNCPPCSRIDAEFTEQRYAIEFAAD